MSEKLHDLTILYLSKQDISTLTPSPLYDKYQDVYNELKCYSKDQKPNGVTILKR